MDASDSPYSLLDASPSSGSLICYNATRGSLGRETFSYNATKGSLGRVSRRLAIMQLAATLLDASETTPILPLSQLAAV